MTVAFRIAAPIELAEYLLTLPDVAPIAAPAEISSQEKGRLDFDLQTAAAVVTIVIGAADLAAHALTLAGALRDWRQRRAKDERVVLQGPTQDKVIMLDASVTIEVLAADIEHVARD